MPEPDGELLVSQRIERPQDDPYERRFLRDGEVWEYTSSDAHVVDGEMVFEKVPLEWRRIAQLPADAVAEIEGAAEGVLDLPAEQAPPGTSTGGAVVTYDVAAGGREHTVKLINLAPNEVRGIAELDMAMQLAVARASSPE